MLKNSNKIKVLGFVILFMTVSFYSYGKAAYQTIKSNVKEKIVISPKKPGKGRWKLESYDKKIVELIEDKKSPFQSYVFRTIKKGYGEVRIKHIGEKNKIDRFRYTVQVGFDVIKTDRKRKPRNGIVIKFKNKKTYPKHLKPNEIIKKKQQKNLFYSLPEKEIMKNGDIYYKYIYQLYRKGIYRQGIVEIEKFRLLFPKHKKIEAINLIKAKIFLKLGKYDDAVDWYRRLIEENQKPFSQKGDLMLLLGKSYELNKDIEKARLTYIKTITLIEDPVVLAKAHFSLGQLYFNAKEYKKGIHELETIIKDYPEASRSRELCLYLLGEMYYKKSSIKNYKTSYRYFRRLIEEYPSGRYTRKAARKIKFLEKNFIKYY